MTRAASATVVVELTPPGRAAVAVVLVAGPEALRAVGECFSPLNDRPVATIPLGRIVLGRWGGDGGEELIFCRRGDDQIEIHCHGGAAAVQAVISRLVDQGCQPIQWQDWLRRTSPDAIRVAAQIALADAITERTAAILLDQLNGALSAAIHELIGQISAANWSDARKTIDGLLGWRNLGLHLTKPWRVVVFGPPNVGKSSLVNALAGYERAIISPLPGTTRDVVTVATAIDGWPVQLADTAGIRRAQDELESMGIELAVTTVSEADLVIVVHDATKLNDEPLCDKAKEAPRTIHVFNKIDLIAVAERSELLDRLCKSQSEIDPKLVSALTREGIAGLVAAISFSLVPVSAPAGSAVPFTAEQIDRLAAAREAVEHRDATAAANVLQAMLTQI